MLPFLSLTGEALTSLYLNFLLEGVRIISSLFLTNSPLRANNGGASSIGRGLRSGRKTSKLEANSSISTSSEYKLNSRIADGLASVNFYSLS